MAKIPDATAFGARPTPNPNSGVPNIPGTGAGYARGVDILTADANQSARGVMDFARSVEQAGALIAAGEDRIRTRQDAVARARDTTAFNLAAENELRRLQTEDDLSQMNTVEKYGAFLKNLKDKTISGHQGSGESSLALQARIEEIQGHYSAKVSALSLEAGDKAVADAIGSRINSLSMKSWESPGSIATQFKILDRELADMSPALRPEQERAFVMHGRERIAEAAIGSLIARGAMNEAERVMQNPGMAEILGEKAQNRINLQLITAKQVISNAQQAGLAQVAQIEAMLGRKLLPQEREAFALSPLAKLGDQQTIEIGDATSPTGSRIIPRSMVGQNITPDVLSKYPPGKPSSGLDVQFNRDGTVKSITTGKTPGTSPGLGTEGGNLVDKDLLNALQTRQSIQSITTRFKPEFQQIPTKLKMEWSILKDKGAGILGKLDEGSKADLDEFTQYRAEAGQMFSSILKQLSGVAVNPTEFKRAEAYLPNPGSGVFDGDSPTELEAKIKRFTEFNDKAIARLAYTKARGMKFDDVGLDEMPNIIRQRGNDLEKQLAAEGWTGDQLKNAVKTQISREFGFVGP